MEEAFEKFKSKGHNSVDGVVKWLKDVKILDPSKEADFRKYFTDVADQNHIQIDKFKEALAKLAADQKTTVDELTKKLTEHAVTQGMLLEALEAGASAFIEALTKK